MKVLSIFGTRPEAIKMAPVVRALAAEPTLTSTICVTAQHREMLDQVMGVFGLKPDHDLDLMTENQSLNALFGRIVTGLDAVFDEVRPDRVLVHGDTTTSAAAAVAAFHRRIPVAHVEAGLRSRNLAHPWPEEMNRRLVDIACDLLFAPTSAAKSNLLNEAVEGRIFVTGNTVIDALRVTTERLDSDRRLRHRVDAQLPILSPKRRTVLVTSHRRENLETGLREICLALRDLAQRPDIEIVFPVHPNPQVRAIVGEVLPASPNLHLIEPLEYLPFVRLMQRADIVLTDSGGVQEEAPWLGKPVLVMRDVTERAEAIAHGTAILVGTRRAAIVEETLRRMAADASSELTEPVSPYGDGHAAERIAAAVVGRAIEEFKAPPCRVAA